MNNEDRVKKIKSLLGLRNEDTDEEYYRVADVLCDLRHFCDAEFIDFKDEVEQSELFYKEEKEEVKNE
tara:strand:- start:1364 stop:1567 length:204 start_codon:yes stop_codon:yes gene_type:complete